MELIDNDNDGKRLVSSDYISKSRNFDTKEEAQTWYDNTKKELEATGYTIRDITNDPWAVPAIENFDTIWAGYIEGELIIWEDIPTEVTVEATQ